MTSLGILYENGRGVARDYVKAREWYEKAADKGDERAMAILACFTKTGGAWRRTTSRRAKNRRPRHLRDPRPPPSPLVCKRPLTRATLPPKET